MDEDITKSARFIGEAEELLKEVKAFGESKSEYYYNYCHEKFASSRHICSHLIE